MSFPRTPATGKNGAVYVNTGDGAQLTLSAMTKQASYTYNGKAYTDRIYLLGTGKTLINMRPEVEPEIVIAGIVDGIQCTPTSSNDEVQTSAGTLIDASGVEQSVSADASIAVTRPAVGEGAWVAIHVNMSTQAVSATKGTDTTAGTGKAALLDTYGTAAGEKPYIPTTDLLICYIQLDNGAAVVEQSEIFAEDKETTDIDYSVLPNIGGALLSSALIELHTGGIGRAVAFTGYYMDNAMAQVGTAKSWSFNPNTNDVTESTFFRNISITEISGWTYSFEQLTTDPKVWNNVKNREGYGAVRLVSPNGFYWQGIATMAPTFSQATGAINNISVSGSFLDTPETGDL